MCTAETLFLATLQDHQSWLHREGGSIRLCLLLLVRHGLDSIGVRWGNVFGRARRSDFVKKIDDTAGDLVEGSHDNEFTCCNTGHDAYVLPQLVNLAPDVGDHGLSVSRTLVVHHVEAVVVETTLDGDEELRQRRRLFKKLFCWGECCLHRTAKLVTHDNDHLHLEVVHGVLERCLRGHVKESPCHADREDPAEALVEDHLDGHTGVRTAKNGHLWKLPHDERTPLECIRHLF
mmetsp:Transcript_57992/g.154517  ORF Transcript_57992/g.154517 Transcript_57992/m.154517 type:complete len:233 (+) Transcript_57992:441-1139(+)